MKRVRKARSHAPHRRRRRRVVKTARAIRRAKAARPFFVFLAVITFLVGGVLWFLQSPQFAQMIKETAARYLPTNLGVEGDFTELRVKLFPPGVSILKPSLKLSDKNIARLPGGSWVKAERLDLNFLPLQMFSGNIRVNELVIAGGQVHLIIDDRKDAAAVKKGGKQGFPKLDLKWDQLFQVRAEAVGFENTLIHLETLEGKQTADAFAEQIRISQWSGRGGLGYEVELHMKELRSSLLEQVGLPPEIDRWDAQATVNALGARLDQLSANLGGVALAAKGGVKGNVLLGKGLGLDVELVLQGGLKEVAQLSRRKELLELSMSGGASFKGRLQGQVDKLLETAEVQGKLSLTDFGFKAWKFESVVAEAAWRPNPNGKLGEVRLESLDISGPERPRAQPSSPGWGGRIHVGPAVVNLDSRETLQVGVDLKRVHLHWLAAPALKGVWPLDFRTDGKISAEITLPLDGRSWTVLSHVDLQVLDFSLDNQRLNQIKPLRRILNVPKILVKGNVLIDEGGLVPQNTEIHLPQSHFTANGKVDFRSGLLDLQAGGPVHLEDVGHLADNPIRGDGVVQAHIHGPGNKIVVDFDTELKAANYLHLDLGDAKGRITYDDGVDLLSFTAFRGHRVKTSYQVDGQIYLGKDETLDLGVKFFDGDIQDTTRIFDAMTRDFAWFPHSLKGAMKGDGRIYGGLSLKEMKVDANIQGTNWEFFGERFKETRLQGGYDRGRYFVTSATGVKQKGQLRGTLNLSTDQVLDWEVTGSDLSLGDVDILGQIEVPLRGKILLQSTGHGKVGKLESQTQIGVSEFFVRGLQLPGSQGLFKLENDGIRVQANVLGTQATLDALYQFNPTTESYLRGELKQLDFSTILLLLNPKAIQDRELAGLISGSMNLSFRSGSFDRVSGDLEVSEYLLAKTGTRLSLPQPARVKASDGTFDLVGLTLTGGRPGGETHPLVISLSGRQGALEGRVRGDVDLSIVEFFTPVVTKAGGRATLDLTLGGRLSEPSILGDAQIESGSLRTTIVESPFENIVGQLKLRQNVVQVKSLEADLAGGRIIADGNVAVFASKYPVVDLHGKVKGPKLKVYPFQFAKVDGTLRVEGDRIPYTVSGNLRVDSALSKEKVLGRGGKESAKALRFNPPPTRRTDAGYSKFKLDLETFAPGGVIIQNDLFDAEAKGSIRLVNTIETPRIMGTAEIVAGKLIFRDRAFEIQSGKATFDSPTVLNPALELSASSTINGTKVQLFVSGRMDKPRIEVSSTPSLPENEILQLLAMGFTSSDAQKINVSDRSAVRQGEAASLVLHSLDFNRELESKTGVQIKLDESIVPDSGVSAFRPQQAQTDTGLSAAPKIVIKKQIRVNGLKRPIELSAGSSVGGTTSEREAKVEVPVPMMDSTSATFNVRNFESQDVKSNNRNQIGLDVKYERRWK